MELMSEEIEYDISEYNLQDGELSHEYFISSQTDPEDIAKEFYVNQGYNIIRLTYGTISQKFRDPSTIPKKILEDVNSRLEEKYEFSPEEDFLGGNIFLVFRRKGVPDFLIYKNAGDNQNWKYWFVEVKREGDSLRQNQVAWFTTHSCLPSKVMYIESGSKHTYLKG